MGRVGAGPQRKPNLPKSCAGVNLRGGRFPDFAVWSIDSIPSVLLCDFAPLREIPHPVRPGVVKRPLEHFRFYWTHKAP